MDMNTIRETINKLPRTVLNGIIFVSLTVIINLILSIKILSMGILSPQATNLFVFGNAIVIPLFALLIFLMIRGKRWARIFTTIILLAWLVPNVYVLLEEPFYNDWFYFAKIFQCFSAIMSIVLLYTRSASIWFLVTHQK